MTDFYEDACYLSNSEAEPDSEVEDLEDTIVSGADSSRAKQTPSELQWDDPQALLNTWLGELDNLKVVSRNFENSFLLHKCHRK